jgi:hypothetical protein
MCRSIKRLHSQDGIASQEEIHAAALQYIRKVSGYRKPSKANQGDFDRAVDAVAVITEGLLSSLESRALNPKLDTDRT